MIEWEENVIRNGNLFAWSRFFFGKLHAPIFQLLLDPLITHQDANSTGWNKYSICHHECWILWWRYLWKFSPNDKDNVITYPNKFHFMIIISNLISEIMQDIHRRRQIERVVFTRAWALENYTNGIFWISANIVIYHYIFLPSVVLLSILLHQSQTWLSLTCFKTFCRKRVAE